MRKILLDTNAYTRLLQGDEKVFLTISSSDVVFMSVFVIGELYAGFKGGVKKISNKEILDRFLQKSPVKLLDATIETAEVFGLVMNDLKQAGTPIPLNDVWIASQAIETGSILITYDTHFLRVKGLRYWDYIKI